MEDVDLKKMWKAYNEQLEEAKLLNQQSWVVNLKTFEYLQTNKAASKLKSLSAFKSWAIVLGFLWIILLGMLAFGNDFNNPFFTISIICLMLFSIMAVAIYLKQIVFIQQINYTNSIIDVQKKLADLQTSTLNTHRILWLQLPFYTTFFWNAKWIMEGPNFWLTAFPITVLFTLLTIWLYKNISLENVNKKWLKLLLNNKEWLAILDAKTCLAEIEEFRMG